MFIATTSFACAVGFLWVCISVEDFRPHRAIFCIGIFCSLWSVYFHLRSYLLREEVDKDPKPNKLFQRHCTWKCPKFCMFFTPCYSFCKPLLKVHCTERYHSIFFCYPMFTKRNVLIEPKYFFAALWLVLSLQIN